MILSFPKQGAKSRSINGKDIKQTSGFYKTKEEQGVTKYNKGLNGLIT